MPPTREQLIKRAIDNIAKEQLINGQLIALKAFADKLGPEFAALYVDGRQRLKTQFGPSACVVFNEVVGAFIDRVTAVMTDTATDLKSQYAAEHANQPALS